MFVEAVLQKYQIAREKLKDTTVSKSDEPRLIIRLDIDEFAKAIYSGKPEEIHYNRFIRSTEEGGFISLTADIEKKIEILADQEISYGQHYFQPSGYYDKSPRSQFGAYIRT